MTKPSETQRQWLHIAACSFALLLPWLNASWAFALAMTAFIHNILLLPRYAPWLFHRNERLTQGIGAYPLMVAILILLFPDQLHVVGCVWGILAFGDGFSNLIGRNLPLVFLPWNPEKSLGGTLAFTIMGSLAGCFFLWWIGPTGTLAHLFIVAFIASLFSALFESVPAPWDDNITVTITAAVLTSFCLPLNFSFYTGETTLMWFGTAVALNIIIAVIAKMMGWVSGGGAIGGLIIGTLVLVMGGIDFFLLLISFFLLATLATRIGFHEKALMGGAQENQGKRGAKHAAANCAVPLLAAVLFGWFDGADPWLAIFYCGAVATALSDTVSSELGQLFGRNPFMPGSFQLATPGTPGAISIEGTLWGMGAAALFAGLACIMQTISLNALPAVMMGAWIGFFSESYITAKWKEEGVDVNNEWMNTLNTIIGGSIAVAIVFLTQP